jgi:2-oxoglutarate ferredoxin oxidoreductase subunit alpha
MNTGMMLDDVNLAVKGKVPVEFYGRLGGVTPFPDEILDEIHRIVEDPPTYVNGNARQQWLERLEKIVEGEK